MYNRTRSIRIVSYILGTFHLSALLTLLTCSKPSTNEPNNQRPQIEVTENITENTVWESGKDYIIKGNVIVEENATLAIEKDVHVYFDEDDEEVKGQLDVKGIINANSNDSTKLIMFQSLDYSQGSQPQHGLSFDNAYKFSNFNNCVFSNLLYGIKEVNTGLSVENCRFEKCYHAINISKCDSVLISHCEFTGNDYGIKIELSKGVTDSSFKIINNNFYNCDQIAIEVNNNSSSLITDNYFASCSLAVLCQFTSTVNVSNNDFINCKDCVEYQWNSRGSINYNQFKDGDVFVNLSYHSNVNINYNNFENVQKYNIQMMLDEEISIDAENNWWGAILKQDIDKFIFDEADDNSEVDYGTVDYEPYENSIIENCGVRTF